MRKTGKTSLPPEWVEWVKDNDMLVPVGWLFDPLDEDILPTFITPRHFTKKEQTK